MTLAATTWDAGSKGSYTTLSAGNLTAAMSGNNGRAFATRPCTGKNYWEIVVASASAQPRVGVGEPYCYLASGYRDWPLGYNDAQGFGYDPNGMVYYNNSSVKTLATYASGDTIGVAYDPILQKLWFRVNGGNWNNAAIGVENPANGLGGISVTAPQSYNGSGGIGSFFPAVSGGTGESFTAKFLAASWGFSCPTGFEAIGSSIAAAGNPKPAKVAASAVAMASPRAVCLVPACKRSTRGFSAGHPASPAGAGVSISGVVKESGVPVQGRVVLVYDNATGEFLEKVKSDASGNFSALCRARSKVFAVALDPTTYQAMTFDRITPA